MTGTGGLRGSWHLPGSQAFRGRGSLSRGALLLRATERGRELCYAAVEDPGASPAVI